MAKSKLPMTSMLLKAEFTFSLVDDMFEESFVNRIIQKRIGELNLPSKEDYISYLSINQQEESILVNSLQNSYSEFFRNLLTFSVLEKIVLPFLLQQKNLMNRELRIWSAACASGQEPYSLAILIEEYKSRAGGKIRYRIFATDSSATQIDKARRGSYPGDALGHVNLARLNTWFEPVGNQEKSKVYSIKPALMENIFFSCFDLTDPDHHSPPGSIFGDFDLVFCANLLFYYKPAYRKIILKKLTASLSPGGLIAVGETERIILLKEGFHEIYPQSGLFSPGKNRYSDDQIIRESENPKIRRSIISCPDT